MILNFSVCLQSKTLNGFETKTESSLNYETFKPWTVYIETLKNNLFWRSFNLKLNSYRVLETVKPFNGLLRKVCYFKTWEKTWENC